MNKKSIRDLNLVGKKVLMRVDFNVPLNDGVVADDTRIVAALPSIRHVLENGGALILMSHLGRPKGKPSPEFSLKPVADELSRELDAPVAFAPDCVGAQVAEMAAALKPGEVLLLENLRFHVEEEGKAKVADDASDEEKKQAKAAMKEKQRAFAKELASLGDLYVNDAFGTAHRAHASVAGVAEFIEERAAGFLMQKELDYLGKALAEPERPFVAILGGAKISGKIDVIENLLGKVDTLLIGGGMAYTFFQAQGYPIGESLLEADKVEMAGEILKKAEAKGVRLLLPTDTVVADAFSADANRKVVPLGGIEAGWQGLDIGPESRKAFSEVIATARTVVWNGPMGCFEMAPFAAGTQAVAQALADADCVSIIGGGDSASAVKQAGLADRMTHISTGGGASLEFLEGKALPGVTALSDT